MVKSVGWFLFAMGLAGVGDVMLKKASENGQRNWELVVFAMAPYALTVVPWFYLFRDGRYAIIAGVVYPMVSVLVHVSIGLLVFGEKLSPREWVAAVLTVVVLLLVNK